MSIELNLTEPTRPSVATESWARLAIEIRSPLRLGAWYRVLQMGATEAVLQVRDRLFKLPHSCLEFSSRLPREWTTVERDTGNRYLVCPTCADRVRPSRRTAWLTCTRCGERHEVSADYQVPPPPLPSPPPEAGPRQLKT